MTECAWLSIGSEVSPRRGNVSIFEHVKNNSTDKIHTLGVQGSRFTIEVKVAFPAGCESERWIFTVFEGPRENYFAQPFLHFVNSHSFSPMLD